MSTKAIRDLVNAQKAHAHRVGDDGLWNLALVADAEVAAIERAAKVLDALQSGEPYDEAERGTAYRLMESIAKDEP